MGRCLGLLVALLLVATACGGDAGPPVSQPPATTGAIASTTVPPVASVPPTSVTAPPESAAPHPTTQPPAEVVQTIATNPAGMAVIETETVHGGEGWSLLVSRPRLSGHPDPAVEARVNDAIADLYDATSEAFWTDLDALEEQGGEGFRYDVGIDHEVTLFTDEVLSLRYYLFWSSSEAAHPTDDIETLLVDLETGEPFGLPDLLSADSAPEALLALIDRHILDDLYEGDTQTREAFGGDSTETGFGQWALTRDSFDVSFGRYEAGPGVLGSFTLSIPYEELGVLINPEGPIAALFAG